MGPSKPALSALNRAILRLLSQGRDPSRELMIDDPVVADALEESHRVGSHRSRTKQQQWLDARIDEEREYHREHGFVRTPWRETARAYMSMAESLDRRSRSFAIDYKVLCYLAELCWRHRSEAPVVATRNAVDYVNADRKTVGNALVRLQNRAGLIRLEDHEYGRKVRLSESSRRQIIPGDQWSDRSCGTVRTPSALYERPALGGRGEWLMAALSSGPKTVGQIIELTGFSPKVVRALVAKAVSIGVAAPDEDRFRLAPDFDVDLVIEATGAAKLQRLRQEQIDEDREWFRWREALIAGAIEKHCLAHQSEVAGPGLTFVVLPASDRKSWRASRLGDDRDGVS